MWFFCKRTLSPELTKSKTSVKFFNYEILWFLLVFFLFIHFHVWFTSLETYANIHLYFVTINFGPASIFVLGDHPMYKVSKLPFQNFSFVFITHCAYCLYKMWHFFLLLFKCSLKISYNIRRDGICFWIYSKKERNNKN